MFSDTVITEADVQALSAELDALRRQAEQ